MSQANQNHDDLPTRDLPTRDLPAEGPQPRSAAESLRWAPPTEREGDEIGPYRLVRLLGEGGFGAVWLAERRHPFVQQVALKLIKPGMDSKAVVGRFEQERQALAVMNHAHVAKVLDGGMTALGRPYFVMEFVKGEPISEFCDRRRLAVRERLALFLQVCDAVQHAHTKGIIHRDLKPSNVLVALGADDLPCAKVIDFGIAKAVTGRMTEQTVFTESGQMIGTPEYMSPEQADPGEIDIDTRTDVYSLGVILYELLAGALPFDPRELRSRAYREIQRVIREVDPPSPSARLSTLVAGDAALAARIGDSRRDEPGALARLLRSELEWIPLKAMRKDRSERYDSPAELARDISNYLAGRALIAAPESALYRLRKQARRNRGPVLAATMVLCALLAGLGIATWQWRLAEAQRAEADRARADADAERVRAVDLISAIASGGALDLMRAGDTPAARRELAVLESVGRAPNFAAKLAVAMGDSAALRQFRSAIDDGPYLSHALAISPDGKLLASGAETDGIRIIDLASGKEVGEPIRARATGLAFSPDGRLLAASGSALIGEHETPASMVQGLIMSDGLQITLWDVSTRTMLGEPFGTGSVGSIAFSPDGALLTCGTVGESPMVWSVATRQPIEGEAVRHETTRVEALAFSPDGKLRASGGWDRTIRLWSVDEGRPVGEPWRGHAGIVHSVAFHPEGRMLASGSSDGTVRLWNVETGMPLGDPLVANANTNSIRTRVNAVRFSSDGRLLAAAGDDRLVRLWDVATRELVCDPFSGSVRSISALAISPDGGLLAAASTDGVGRTWNLAAARALGQLGPMSMRSAENMRWSPDGASLLVVANGEIRAWDVVSGRLLGSPVIESAGPVDAFAISPDGRLLAASLPNEGDGVRLWRLPEGAPTGGLLKGGGEAMKVLRFDPAGRFLASGDGQGFLRIWEVESGRKIAGPVQAHEWWLGGIAFSPDGSIMATIGGDGNIVFWEPSTGRRIGDPLKVFEREDVRSVEFAPDGKTVLSAGATSIHFWDVATRREIGRPIVGIESRVRAAVLSPDGQIVAGIGNANGIQLWDVATRRPLGQPLQAPVHHFQQVAFRADGAMLAGVGFLPESRAKRIVLWSTEPLRTRAEAFERRMGGVEVVRSLLADRIREVGASTDAWKRLRAEVIADQRFTGDLRTAAAIVMGEIELRCAEADAAAKAESEARIAPLMRGWMMSDWPQVLEGLQPLSEGDLRGLSAGFWQILVDGCLSDLPADSPWRDPERLLGYAERAVRISERRDAAPLMTLARVHWARRDKAQAVRIAEEAVARAKEARARRADLDLPSPIDDPASPDEAAEAEALLERYREEAPAGAEPR